MNIPAREIANTKISCFRYINDKKGLECTLEDFLIKVGSACKELIYTLRSIQNEKD